MLLFHTPPPIQPMPQAASISVFEADRYQVHPGDPVELKWEAVGLDAVVLDPLDQRLPPRGHLQVHPTETTTYWLSAANWTGGLTRPLTIRVLGPQGANTHAVWIQFAAMDARPSAERLARELAPHLQEPPGIQEAMDPGDPRHTVFRVRSGPFPSVPIARKRLHSWLQVLHRTGLHPIVTSP